MDVKSKLIRLFNVIGLKSLYDTGVVHFGNITNKLYYQVSGICAFAINLLNNLTSN